MSKLDEFIEQWSGQTEELSFYHGEIKLRYDKENHEYLLLKDGNFILQDNTTTVVHVIDKSNALMPWAVKKSMEKLIKLLPIINAPDGKQLIHIDLEEFNKLITQAKTAPRDEVEAAAEVGKIAHAWIEDYIKSVLYKDENKYQYLLNNLPIDERAANCCKAGLDWMQRHNVRWHCTERKVYSRRYKYCGTMDGLATVDSCDDVLCCPNEFKDHLSLIDWKTSNYLYIEYLYQTASYQWAYDEEFDAGIVDRWILRLGKDNAEFDPWYLNHDTFAEDFNGWLHTLELYRSINSVETRMKITKDWIKQEKKKRLKELKEKELAIKCKNSDKYKGIHYPRCNKGNPCEYCLNLYNSHHQKPLDKSV